MTTLRQTTPLLSHTPIARASDPVTSHEAAANIEPKLGRLKARVLLMADSTPRTARELAELCAEQFGGDYEDYRKRVGELKAFGKLYKHPNRPCSYTNATAATFATVPPPIETDAREV